MPDMELKYDTNVFFFKDAAHEFPDAKEYAKELIKTCTEEEKMLTLPSPTDTIKLTVGCKKRFQEDCNLRFGNKLNYQGFPHLPGTQVIRKFGGQ